MTDNKKISTIHTDRISESGLPLIFSVNSGAPALIGEPGGRTGNLHRASFASLSGFQKQALVASPASGSTWRLVSDEGKNLAGFDAAPTPLGYFSAGLVAAYMSEACALAKQRGADASEIRLTLDNYYLMAGSMQRRDVVSTALSPELTVEIQSTETSTQWLQLVAEAVATTPLNGLVRNCTDGRFRLTHNNEAIDPAHLPLVEGPLVQPVLDNEASPTSDGPTLLTAIGPSPPVDTPVRRARTESLKSSTDGLLVHVAARAIRRPDGLIEVRQQFHAPAGTEWLFLVANPSDGVDTGIAPDANSLATAGIGFCLMTQFDFLSRAIRPQPIGYEIIQDTYSSPGGATSATGKISDSGSIETHIHMTADAGKEQILELVTLAERACFLHALCKTELKPKIRIRS
ncbi:MAG: hypothetical protein AB3N19_08550 [Ruegeria sp.]